MMYIYSFFFLSLGLSVFSIYDIRYRRVPNLVSFVLIVLGLIVHFFLGFSQSLNYLEIVLIILFLFIIQYVGAIGGADTKAIIFSVFLVQTTIANIAILLTLIVVFILVELGVKKPPVIPIYQGILTLFCYIYT